MQLMYVRIGLETKLQITTQSLSSFHTYLTDGVEPASLGAALPCRLLDLGVLGDDMSLKQPNL